MTTFTRMQKLAGIVAENQMHNREEEYNEDADLFNNYDLLPAEVVQILNKYEDEDQDYETLLALAKELEPLGYTFDSYLDATPYNLRKID